LAAAAQLAANVHTPCFKTLNWRRNLAPSDSLVIFEWFATIGAVAFLALCAWYNYRSREGRATTGLEQFFAWISSLAGEDEAEAVTSPERLHR
jgi:hypothetical protein